jgi:hypothetical protein
MSDITYPVGSHRVVSALISCLRHGNTVKSSLCFAASSETAYGENAYHENTYVENAYRENAYNGSSYNAAACDILAALRLARTTPEQSYGQSADRTVNHLVDRQQDAIWNDCAADGE